MNELLKMHMEQIIATMKCPEHGETPKGIDVQAEKWAATTCCEGFKSLIGAMMPNIIEQAGTRISDSFDEEFDDSFA